jgi:hypothetical protein
MTPNHITALDAALTIVFHVRRQRRGASEFNRSPEMRGTSAALGKRHKMIPSLFSNLVWRASGAPNQIGKKRDWVWVAFYPGRRPRRPCPGLLSCRPSRGSGGHINGRRRREIGHRWANHRLQARPGFAWLFVLRPQPGLPEPRRYAKVRR